MTRLGFGVRRRGPLELGQPHGRLWRLGVVGPAAAIPVSLAVASPFAEEPVVTLGAAAVLAAMWMVVAWLSLRPAVTVRGDRVEIRAATPLGHLDVDRDQVAAVTLARPPVSEGLSWAPALVAPDGLVWLGALRGLGSERFSNRARTAAIAGQLAGLVGVPLLNGEEAADHLGLDLRTTDPGEDVELRRLGVRPIMTRREAVATTLVLLGFVCVIAAFQWSVPRVTPWLRGDLEPPDMSSIATISGEGRVYLREGEPATLYLSGIPVATEVEVTDPSGEPVELVRVSIPEDLQDDLGDRPAFRFFAFGFTAPVAGEYHVAASVSEWLRVLSGDVAVRVRVGDPPEARDALAPPIGSIAVVVATLGGAVVLVLAARRVGRVPQRDGGGAGG